MRFNKRFLFTLFLIAFLVVGTSIAIFLAKGYRFSTKTGTLSGTGIISVTSIPDQASVFVDGHLTTATNANISSLLPKSYDVKITKDGFIPWEKQIVVKEGLVSQIKATLFPAIPTIYPLTFNGVENVNLAPDGQRFVFIVPPSADDSISQLPGATSLRKSGVWVWNMNTNPLPFAGGPEPHRVADLIPGLDYTKATIRWAPDSSQLLVTLPDRELLMNSGSFSDTGQDITATLQSTLNGWNLDKKNKDALAAAIIKDPVLRNEATSSAVLKWAPDQTKFFYSKDGKTDFKVVDLTQNQTYSIPTFNNINWLPDSRHFITVENQPTASTTPVSDKEASVSAALTSAKLIPGKVSIIEFDGSNKDELYVGSFDPVSVFAWPDSSRLVIVSSVPTPTGSIPNLFGINLK